MARKPAIDGVQAEVGRRIRAARVRAELTQEEAASVAGIDYKRWQRLEAGEVNCTIRTLVRVSAALNTTIWKLLSEQPRAGRS